MSSNTPFADGRQAALSLTYDDGSPTHLDVVGPLLVSHGLRATFYPHLAGAITERFDEWREMAKIGHELGNHSIFHPCRNRTEDPPKSNQLDRYDLPRLRNELAVGNRILTALDGRASRSYGNTCHNRTVGVKGEEEPIEPVLAELFSAARGSHRGQDFCGIDPMTCDLMNVGTTGADGTTLEQLQERITRTIDEGRWLILTAHHVRPAEERLTWDIGEHQRTIEWLATLTDQLWIAPVDEVALRVRSARGEPLTLA